MSAALRLQLVPTTRGDCLPGGVNEARPCPHRSCRWHLDADRRWMDQVTDFESCSLDVADRGGVTLEEIGALLGLTRERVRQVEEEAMEKLTRRFMEAL